MKINDNGIIREMTEDEILNMEEINASTSVVEIDNDEEALRNRVAELELALQKIL